MAPQAPSSLPGSRSSRAASNKGAVVENNDSNNQGKASKKKRSRRRRKPKSQSKVEPLHPSSATSKKQHDAPMTKRDLYFSLTCEVVLVGQDMDAATSVHEVAVARVTILNWDTEVILDTFVEVPGQVIDSMGTGITTKDIQEDNPQAMNYSVVRNTVERILCGKILIGYKLQESLAALSLSHPSTDVRDILFYGGASKEDRRSIDELTEDVLERSLPPSDDRHRAIEVCIATLDLYKANRKDWEMNLIARARENGQPATQDAQLHPPVSSRHGRNPYPPPHGPQQPQPNAMYPTHGMPHSQDFSHRVAVSANYSVPPNYSLSLACHPMVHSPAALQHPRQQEAMMMAAQAAQAQANRNSSSWFSIGRKSRYPQQASAPIPPSAAQASLSSQAIQALSYPSSSFDYYESSSYGGSTGYDISTDYGSSRRYGSSVVSVDSADSFVSGSVGSVVSESVGSIVSEPTDIVKQHEVENRPRGTFDHEHRHQSSSGSSSWFRFGSRKSRYSQQHREPMTVVQESNEPESATNNEEIVNEIIEESAPLNDELGRNSRHGNGLAESKKQSSSSWFGFKRSKSPSSGRRDKSAAETPDEVEQSDHDESAAGDDENVRQTEPTSEKADTKTMSEKQSSWFKFGRRSSVRSKSPLPVGTSPQEDELPHDEVVTLHTQVSSDSSDEDWWQEVMNHPSNVAEAGDADADIVNMEASAEEKWIEQHTHSPFTPESQEGLVDSSSKSSTWFRFLRSTKSSSAPETTLLDSENLETAEFLEQPPFDDNSKAWLPQMSSQAFDPACLGPAWFNPDKQQQPEAENTQKSAVSFKSPSKDAIYNGLQAIHEPSRARIPTESTIPSVSTGDPVEDDDSSSHFDFVQGIEKHFSFLNI